MKRSTVIKKIESIGQDNLALRYKKRSGIFENYKGSCAFNPETYSGHSYRWYELTKLIKGQVILNVYTYSNQTAQHIVKVRSVMEALGIKYKTLEAPRGLQNLEESQQHHIKQLGRALIEFKHARKKSTHAIKYHQKALALLAKFGLKTSQSKIDLAEDIASAERVERLIIQREKALKRKLETYLEQSVCFRDYEIKPASQFGKYNKIAVHQVVERESLERDVENALQGFHRDGFGSVVFYVKGAQ